MPAADLQQLEAASLSIEALAAEIQTELERKYAFYRMLGATDQVLEALEQLNLRGIREVPAGTYRRIHHALRELPSCALEALRDSHKTQEVLDGIFDCQEALFLWHDPKRVSEPEEELQEPTSEAELVRRRELFRNAVLRRLTDAQAGHSRNYLITTYALSASRDAADGWLDEMEGEGLVRWESAPPGRRYLLAGERARP